APPTSTLFPYTTLFRSKCCRRCSPRCGGCTSRRNGCGGGREREHIAFGGRGGRAGEVPPAAAPLLPPARPSIPLDQNPPAAKVRSEEHTSELQSPCNLV